MRMYMYMCVCVCVWLQPSRHAYLRAYIQGMMKNTQGYQQRRHHGLGFKVQASGIEFQVLGSRF